MRENCSWVWARDGKLLHCLKMVFIPKFYPSYYEIQVPSSTLLGAVACANSYKITFIKDFFNIIILPHPLNQTWVHRSGSAPLLSNIKALNILSWSLLFFHNLNFTVITNHPIQHNKPINYHQLHSMYMYSERCLQKMHMGRSSVWNQDFVGS